jgi:uncharacterized protein (DUF934 family)
MPTLIRLEGGVFIDAADGFAVVAADDPIPTDGGVILPLGRFEAEGAALLDEGRPVGVLLQPDEAVEGLAYDLPRLSLVALAFPRFRDGRPYSSAALLRSRLGFTGEIRAAGEVLREQAREMVRCGFDAFVPSDGSGAADWAAAAGRYRHVYQTAADRRAPAFLERALQGRALLGRESE